MSTIVVVTSSPPFAEGGHTVMARELVSALRESGHESTLVVTPQNRFGRQGSAYLAAWCTDVEVVHEEKRVDQVISLRFPGYAVQHPNHVLWLNHRMREYYDLWDQFSSHLTWKQGIKERARRAMIHRADRYLFNRMQQRFVISATVQARLRRFGNIQSDVLYPPPPRRAYRHEGYGNYLFGVSRLAPLKRFDLVLRALAEPVAATIQCVIAGEGAELDRLRALASHLDIEHRVRFIGRISDEEMIDHLARCRGVVFPPFNEDYGFVTVEAYMCGKAVITCVDSGGPSELVGDGETGFVTEPTPEAIAEAMRKLMDDRTLAQRMGEAGHAIAAQMTWPKAVEQLVR
ncbi:MAG TPA: glycosyltransferase family 4 protein [Vicinamibacterales bacterium]|nr:glycosyltransferase family 4 protein [Vicinamibacterales bacterium]